MRLLMRMTRRCLTPILGACVLLTAGLGAPVLLTAGTAQAAVCPGTPVPLGTACTITGTLSVTAGGASLTSPTALGWTETVTGLDQNLVDVTPGDQSFWVNDSRGTAAGWHITSSATQFATTGGTVHTLGNTGTLAVNGSVAAMDSTAPGAACATTSTCTLPTNTTSYPVAITTAATTPTAVSLFDAGVGTGLGTIDIGLSGGAPVGWWLNVPGNTIAGTYTSTVTLELLTAP